MIKKKSVYKAGKEYENEKVYLSSRYMTIAVLKIDMSHNMVLRHQSK